ncbi:hypothetical protein M378DRAFT_162897 [Amanita muscaria Koide BX008]|uniref:Uncharacterized protein n=1 Tax=Amanita muscaria (strain Koide BX008) TaxID=946122 RepID=A0A0C2X650_AMAMK|nr:hypothetical protein M378DRAFT_162897 [Amanita muscaria Koide BX008]
MHSTISINSTSTAIRMRTSILIKIFNPMFIFGVYHTRAEPGMDTCPTVAEAIEQAMAPLAFPICERKILHVLVWITCADRH